MTTDVISVIAGLVLLFLGGEGLVRGAVAVAERLGLSKLLIGLTIVAFGTSAPELLVAVDAALSDTPEIAIGNVVGSNTANVLLILGIAVAIAPITGWRRSAMRDGLFAGVVALGLLLLVQGDMITRLQGVILLVVLCAYLAVTYWLERREKDGGSYEEGVGEFEDIAFRKPWLAPVLIVLGIGALVWGADLLVGGAVSIAREVGVSDAVIGLSLVAIGTSLPELATAVVAAYRRHADVVLGNVIGSNIFNILAILGITVVVQPIAVAERFRDIDTLVMVGAGAILALLLVFVRRIGRTLGLAMLLAYAAYMVVLFTR